MSHYDTLRGHQFQAASNDVRGANLYGEGGKKLARVNDVVFEHEGAEIRYLVADCGYGRRVLVPVELVIAHSSAFHSSLSSDDLAHLPAFDESLLSSSLWHTYEALYRSALDGVPEDHLKAKSNVTSIDRKRSASLWNGFQQQLRRELPRLQQDCQNCRTDDRRNVA